MKDIRVSFIIVLLGFAMFSPLTLQVAQRAFSSSEARAQEPPSVREIIINQSQTWYGDFTVNATDTVIIEDSEFTVLNGIIQVYGSLIVKNSTLTIRSNTLSKYIWVYGNSSQAGNLSILDSEFTGNYISAISTPPGSDLGPNIEILVHNSRMPTTLITGSGQYGTVNVSSSQLGQLYFFRENCSYFVSNSSIDRVNAYFGWGSVSPIFENSSINDFYVGGLDGVDLELRTGFIQSLSLQNQVAGSSLTLHDCSVNHWYIDNPGDVGLANSEIEMVILYIMAPSVPLDLTFENGSIQNYHLTIEQSGEGPFGPPIDLTVENTTIHNWDLSISGHNSTESTFRISNSNASVGTFADNNLNLVISNSTMKWIQAQLRPNAMGSLNLTLLDSNVTSFWPCYSVGSMNLTLQEGHQDFINLYNQEEGSNVTIINSEISYWGPYALGTARVNIYDTTMTGQDWAETYVSGNANVSICNSHLKQARARRNSFLSVVDSSIDQLTCHDNANVTLVNSTITTLITDPVQVTLIDSRILSEVYSSLPLDFNTEFLEQPPAPLPDNTYGVGKCLHVTQSSGDIFDAQIRIYYDAVEMAKQGISEGCLTMFCLEEDSSSWQTCPIQGVDTGDNFVWANVTHFSHFVVAWSSTWELDFTGPTNHPIVDFAVYNGSLYAAADNKLYVKEGSIWSTIDAPTFVTSLEPYGGKLVVGGQGCLYVFDGDYFCLTGIPAENPLAYWKFDEGSGNIAHDLSGNFDGTVYGASWTSGMYGEALQFDGVDDYVDIPSLYPSAPTSLTVSAWINSSLTSIGYVIHHPAYGEFLLHNGERIAGDGASGRYPELASFSVKLGDGHWYDVYSASPLTPNAWHYLVGVWVKGAYLKIYVDGVLSGGRTDIPVLDLWAPGISPYVPTIGSSWAREGEPVSVFDGAIDEIIVYDYAKTSEEVWNDFSRYRYVKVLGVYDDMLYAGTMLDNPPKLYYCNGSAENPVDWHVDTGFSTILNFSGPFGSIDSFAEYNGILYITSGGTIYSFNGTDWNIANTFDDVYGFSSMKIYDSKLYLATRDQGWRKPLYQGGTGFSGRVIEFDGENWTTVLDHDYWVYSLEVYDDKLYAGTANKILTYNGTSWETSFNATEGAYYAISLIIYDGKIYAGMGNGYIFADPAPVKAEQETIIVPEFPSTTILAVFMALTMLAAALTKKKRTRRFS